MSSFARTGLSVVVIAIIAAGVYVYLSDQYTKTSINSSRKNLQAQFEQIDREATNRAKSRIETAVARETKAIADYKGNEAQSFAYKSEDCLVSNPSSPYVLVNKQNCLNASYAPSEPVLIGTGFYLHPAAAASWHDMAQTARKSAVALMVTSAYRSYAAQSEVYDQWMRSGGATTADEVSAKPGYSEHQTGLAVDLYTPGCSLDCFATSAAYTWLKQHAQDFGFIERYPDKLSAITGYKYEPWHWRYVGPAIASDMKRKGIATLEVYLEL